MTSFVVYGGGVGVKKKLTEIPLVTTLCPRLYLAPSHVQ